MIILAPLSWLFSVLIWFRNQLFDRGLLTVHKLPGVVISIGNIAVGGTGKSPIVIDFCRKILSQGGNPAIVTRGYRSGLAGAEWQVLKNGSVVAGVSRLNSVADEARMQSLALGDVPVIVGAKRRQAVLEFLTTYKGRPISHWILDDGFQHRSIFRDLDVVVLDARSPSGLLVPAGFFREPESSLSRAHVAILTKSENRMQIEAGKKLVQSASPKCEIFEVSFVAEAPLCRFAGGAAAGSALYLGARWALVSSISRPEDFEAMLRVQGIIPVETFVSPDHCSMKLDQIMSAKNRFDVVITTEKDWARDETKYRSLGVPIYVLPLTVRWQGESLSVFSIID